MNRSRIFIFLLLMFPLNMWSLIFVNSSPFKANVYIGNHKIGQTPLVIHTNTSKNLEFRIEKEGYYSKRFVLEVKTSVTNMHVQLISKSFSVQFPNRQYIILNGKKYESDHIQNLPDGYYRFEQDKETIYARRVNPNRSLLYMNLVIGVAGVAGGITGILVGNDVYRQYEQARSYSEALKLLNTSLALDNFALASFVVGGGSTLLSAYYLFDDWQVMSKNKDIKITSQEYLSEDRDIFERALDKMGQDRAKDALHDFNEILNRFPESRFYPMALLRRAELYSRQNKYTDAMRDLEKLRNEYPVYEIYELDLKALADIYVKLKKNTEAISVYSELRQVNSIYPAYLIDYYYVKVLQEQWNQTGASDVAVEIRKIGNAFVDNPSYPDSFKTVVKSVLAAVQ